MYRTVFWTLGEGEGGMIWENGIETCILSYCVQLFATPQTVAHQASLSMGFSRQEYCSGLPIPSPGIFPTQGLNLDRRFLSYILYLFQCHPPKSSPSSLSQSPKDCSIHLCLFCCLTYKVIVIIFLNSIYMR